MTLAWLPPVAIPDTLGLLNHAVERSQYGGSVPIALMERFNDIFILDLLPRVWSCFDKDQLLSTWPKRVRQLLINQAFPGRQVTGSNTNN